MIARLERRSDYLGIIGGFIIGVVSTWLFFRRQRPISTFPSARRGSAQTLKRSCGVRIWRYGSFEELQQVGARTSGTY